ncbi:MAG: hypothetical protein K5664_00335 [Firmicutes bacterium]|nr:hypothetical protein [Bacillota bacterium]
MKKIKKILCSLFCMIMMIITPLKTHSMLPPSNPPNSENSGENPQSPDVEQNNNCTNIPKWYNIHSMDLINNAVEYNTGLNMNSGDSLITIGQAASILSYIKMYLYSNHGDSTEFQKNCTELQKHAISSMAYFENRDVPEHHTIIREQFIHLIIYIFDSNIDEPYIDPYATVNTAFTINAYVDSDSISEFYQGDMQKAIDLGYIYGTDYGELLPKSCVSLSDLVLISERVIQSHLGSHKFSITVTQIKSELSKLNQKYLKIPSKFTKIIFSSGVFACLLGIYLNKSKKSHKKMKHKNDKM